MANNTNHKQEKTITLNKLVPTDYRMWVVQAEATLGVYECLDIVRGNEQNPTPAADTNSILPVINAALCTRINDWNRRHARARETLLKCLEPAEMIKVYSVRENAVTIWTCLYKEYGHILDIEYIRVDTQFHILRKEKETSMHDHIKSERELEENGDNGSKQSDRPYQPSFSRPYQMSAKVTHLIANNTEIEPAKETHKWIVNSAANAYITSFKNSLHNYVDFTEMKNVKGFGGKKEKAYGQGYIILTDSNGYEETLEDVVYVPNSPDQIQIGRASCRERMR